MSETILDLINKRIVLFDGAMGTELIKKGLPKGTCPEYWNLEKPEIIKEIHQRYYNAGSDAVLTNSFGGNKIKLSAYKMQNKCYGINFKAAKIANESKLKRKYVGGSIGPTGKFLKPYGKYTEEDFINAYYEQTLGLSEGGVDFILIETQYDLREAICALEASKKASNLPIFVTMTFKKTPRGYFTLMGNSVIECMQKLKYQETYAIGANCTLDSKEMTGLTKIIRKYSKLPIIIQANSGKPSLSSDGKVIYSQSIEDYVRFIPGILKNGANIIGGCCGTNPDYILRMAKIIKIFNKKRQKDIY